ncbi:MAG: hypothetical protein HFJ04_00555 [Lachnospiraceae bacterium]|nr:hypothetical protein [Lachnospiraceae bacterium]
MENKDTIDLLKECDSGTKMAVSSIDEVLEEIKDSNLRQKLSESKEHHTKLGNELHALLLKYNSEEQDPAPLAKGMSWLKTNMKMGMEHSDATAADLITDGCNMGIKSLYKYLNKYSAANQVSKDICKRLISIEDALCKDMRVYL